MKTRAVSADTDAPGLNIKFDNAETKIADKVGHAFSTGSFR